ncbi:MAG: hypothetical protein IGS39_13395 [Calothrix sp. C42_A2020_038]|nr:hypothetical protein [Calothrix sp. C42_A2020_038]
MAKIFNCKTLFVALGLGITTVSLFAPVVWANSSKTQIVAQSAERFRVVGNEPFWGVDVSQKGIVYTWLSDTQRKQTFRYVAPQKAEGRPLDVLRVYRLGGRADNLLIINKVNGYCSDTMSDTKYPYTATLILGNTVRTGCAEKR